jgi:hypothetical protein
MGVGVLLAYAGPNDLHDEGVGTYSDASVANQISNFTINRQMVSCGVGTVAPGGVSTGPFAMLMYAKDISHYFANHNTKIITASGRMRSMTLFGGALAEDVEHDFIAIAQDIGSDPFVPGAPGDRFDVHFHTPFWNPANPLCTPSTQFPGNCRFGGQLLRDSSGTHQLGDITVGP